MTPEPDRNGRIALLWALGLTLAVHGICLTSDFADEDLRHLFDSQKLELGRFLLRPYGNHFCATFRMAVLALHAVFGAHAMGFYAVMLATHLLDVALVFSIQRNLNVPVLIAGVVAALWGSAPAFQGSLQWFAAFSHVLGATAALIPFWELTRIAASGRPPPGSTLLRMAIVIFLGSGTELTGAATALMFPVVAALVLPREAGRRRTVIVLSLAALVSGLVVLSITEEKNTVAMAFFFWGAAAKMLFELLAYGVGMTVLGPFVTLDARGSSWFLGLSVETVLLGSALVAVPAYALLLLRLWRGDGTERRLLLALLALSLGVYGLVAIGRSGLTMNRSVEWMATRDRYHYDAGSLLWIAIGLALSKTVRLDRLPQRGFVATMAGASILWGASGTHAARSTYLWGGGRQQWTHDWSVLADESVRLMIERTPPGGVLYVKNELFKPAALIYAMGAPHSDLPGIAALWVVEHGTEPFHGRTVRFVEPEAVTLRRVHARYRANVQSMFVSVEEAAAANAPVRTIQGNVPDEVWSYINESDDPSFVQNDHALAMRLSSVMETALTGPPTPWGPVLPLETIPDPAAAPKPPPPPLPTDPTERAREEMRRAIEADPKLAEEMRKAIAADPKATEEVRKAILADPKAIEQLQKELREAGNEE